MQTLKDIIKSLPATYSVTDDKTHYISRDVAENYILNYKGQFGILIGSWAEFEIPPIPAANPDPQAMGHEGLLIWLYLDSENIFKIAYEYQNNYIITTPQPPYIDPNRPYPTSYRTGYFSNEITKRDLENTISTMNERPTPPSSILGRDLLPAKDNFYNFMNSRSAPGIQVDPQACYLPFAFFHRDQLNDLMNRNVDNNQAVTSAATRIFLGYDPSLPHSKNRTRIILAGVSQVSDANGNRKNIWNENAIILEKSWPPN